MRLAEALTELFLPAACAGCRRAPAAGSGLCDDCAAILAGARVRSPGAALAAVRDPACPPVVVAGPYEGPLAEVLNEYKERGRRELAPVLAALLARATEVVAAEVPDAVLVPVPATRTARRRRGFDHVAALCAATGRAHPCLRARPRADSIGLSAARRRREAEASLVADRRRAAALAASGRPAILVDDIVTTGATLGAAAAALRRAGVAVPAAAAVAAAV